VRIYHYGFLTLATDIVTGLSSEVEDSPAATIIFPKNIQKKCFFFLIDLQRWAVLIFANFNLFNFLWKSVCLISFFKKKFVNFSIFR
jgi:hypothetical protein